MKEIIVDGVTYRPAAPVEGGRVIVVLDQRHVVTGFPDADDPRLLRGAAVVRRWGTDRGLGQLAEYGPQDAEAAYGPTRLDPCPDAVRIQDPILTFACLDGHEEAWKAAESW